MCQSMCCLFSNEVSGLHTHTCRPHVPYKGAKAVTITIHLLDFSPDYELQNLLITGRVEEPNRPQQLLLLRSIKALG